MCFSPKIVNTPIPLTDASRYHKITANHLSMHYAIISISLTPHQQNTHIHNTTDSEQQQQTKPSTAQRLHILRIHRIVDRFTIL